MPFSQFLEKNSFSKFTYWSYYLLLTKQISHKTNLKQTCGASDALRVRILIRMNEGMMINKENQTSIIYKEKKKMLIRGVGYL